MTGFTAEAGASGITARMGEDKRTLLNAATATGAGTAYELGRGIHSVFAWGKTSSGAGAATINIEVSNDGTYWVVAGTFSLTLATTVTTGTNTDGFNINAGWKLVRANCTAISGTGAQVTVTI